MVCLFCVPFLIADKITKPVLKKWGNLQIAPFFYLKLLQKNVDGIKEIKNIP